MFLKCFVYRNDHCSHGSAKTLKNTARQVDGDVTLYRNTTRTSDTDSMRMMSSFSQTETF